jgi:hypothetical protein
MSTLVLEFHCRTSDKGRIRIKRGKATGPVEAGSTPRITRLMALAIRFDRLLRDGEVKDYAELARLGHVTRARMSQIMGLLNLAPDIQEEILFLPKTIKGRDPISAREVIQIAILEDWQEQRKVWWSVASQ